MKEINRKRETRKRNEWFKITYTNINRFTSKEIDLIKYLRDNYTDIRCIVQTKLVEETDLVTEGKSNYNILRKDKKQGRGRRVMMLLKSSLKVNEVRNSRETAEVISVQVMMKLVEKHDIITTCFTKK